MRNISIFIIASLLIFSLFGCAKNSGGPDGPPQFSKGPTYPPSQMELPSSPPPEY